jgi:aspartate 1-decarboxylase
MRREMMKAKLHRARITGADKAYEGSLSVGTELLEASGIDPYERVQVVNVTNGERLETYVIEGDEGEMRLNGAAARRGREGDVVIVINYGRFGPDEEPDPTVVKLGEGNEIRSVE